MEKKEKKQKAKTPPCSTQFITNETAYRQATKCPCPFQWKSNIPTFPGV
jgi:hypothetical protein